MVECLEVLLQLIEENKMPQLLGNQMPQDPTLMQRMARDLPLAIAAIRSPAARKMGWQELAAQRQQAADEPDKQRAWGAAMELQQSLQGVKDRNQASQLMMQVVHTLPG